MTRTSKIVDVTFDKRVQLGDDWPGGPNDRGAGIIILELTGFSDADTSLTAFFLGSENEAYVREYDTAKEHQLSHFINLVGVLARWDYVTKKHLLDLGYVLREEKGAAQGG